MPLNGKVNLWMTKALFVCCVASIIKVAVSFEVLSHCLSDCQEAADNDTLTSGNEDTTHISVNSQWTLWPFTQSTVCMLGDHELY